MAARALLIFLTFATAFDARANTDPYLWLEEINGEQALAWAREQTERSLAELTGDERFVELQTEALEILTSQARLPTGEIHGGYLYNVWQDAEHVRGIWRRASLDSYVAGEPEWDLLLDLDALAETEQENWIYKGYDCLAPKFDRCIIRLSHGGTDASVYREYSINDRAFVEDGFYLSEAKSNIEWINRDAILVGTDWGEGSLTESGYPRIVKMWRRGTSLLRAGTVYEGNDTDVSVGPNVFREGKRIYVFIQRNLTFYERKHFLNLPDGRLLLLPLPGKSGITGVLHGRAIVQLREDWQHDSKDYSSGSLVAFNLEDLTAELIFAPTPRQAVNDVEISHSSLFIEVLEDVSGKIKRAVRGDDGWHMTDVPLPDQGVLQIVSTNPNGEDLLVIHESLTTPESLIYVSADDEITQVDSLPAFFDASNVVVEQRFAQSKDGTEVPYYVMARKDVLETGNAPTVQYGYGGFLIATKPYYYSDPARPQHGALAGRMWVSRGGVLVLSNIRGGGEYGPAWHAAALKHNRHKAYEDFFAISEDLIATGVTTPSRLGAIGRSNGGLLMGVAFTQRPDLYAAIDCGVPLADMIRYDKLLAGASWVAEYGDPDIAEDREYLLTYSPYQNIDADAVYPEVFYYTSTMDDRVHPGHARKMAARMQANDQPFLYYENFEGGHGGTANQEQLAFRTALEYMYFIRALMSQN